MPALAISASAGVPRDPPARDLGGGGLVASQRAALLLSPMRALSLPAPLGLKVTSWFLLPAAPPRGPDDVTPLPAPSPPPSTM